VHLVGFIITIYDDARSHERHTSVICSLCRALIRLLKYVLNIENSRDFCLRFTVE